VTAAWVTLEGVEGVGKTYLARRLADDLAAQVTLVDEVTDHGLDTVNGRVITALMRTGDVFLRTGHPVTETFALLALKTREYETVTGRIDDERPSPRIVLEDRGVDSVAIYQAVILADDPPAIGQAEGIVRQIYATAWHWRPPPDRTILLVDDLEVCINRFEDRLGLTLPSADRRLIKTAARLYAAQAAAEPERFTVVSRAGRSEDDVLDELRHLCLTAPSGRGPRDA
jgi:dTMP kinase